MSTTQWQERAAKLAIDGRAFIDGFRVEARSGARFDCLSPVDGRKLAEVARCDGRDADAAVLSARAAFEDRRWAGIAPAPGRPRSADLRRRLRGGEHRCRDAGLPQPRPVGVAAVGG